MFQHIFNTIIIVLMYKHIICLGVNYKDIKYKNKPFNFDKSFALPQKALLHRPEKSFHFDVVGDR
jgi:hypothetical protein